MNMPGEKRRTEEGDYGRFLSGAQKAIVILVIVLVVLFVVFLSQRAYSLGYETVSYKPTVSESEAVTKTVTITEDMSASDIGHLLIDEGLIDESIEAFLMQDTLSGLHGEYVPGTYELDSSMSVNDILQIICTPPEDEDDN